MASSSTPYSHNTLGLSSCSPCLLLPSPTPSLFPHLTHSPHPQKLWQELGYCCSFHWQGGTNSSEPPSTQIVTESKKADECELSVKTLCEDRKCWHIYSSPMMSREAVTLPLSCLPLRQWEICQHGTRGASPWILCSVLGYYGKYFEVLKQIQEKGKRGCKRSSEKLPWGAVERGIL